MLGHLLPAFTGLVVAMLLGLGTPRILRFVKIQPVDSAWPRAEELRKATVFDKESGAPVLGFMERIFFYAAFVLNAPLAIAGWLAFKAAAKWAAWQHVVGMPTLNLLIDDPIQALRYRNGLGTWMVSKTLLGTLYNILCGLGGFIVQRVISG